MDAFLLVAAGGVACSALGSACHRALVQWPHEQVFYG
jgi:hypothetical protein